MRRLSFCFFKHNRQRTLSGLALLLSVFSSMTQASVLDTLRALEAGKMQSAPVTQQATPSQRSSPTAESARRYTLPGGRAVNTEDYRIVLFMQSSCHYCQQFDPQLAQLSAGTGFKVFPYTLDGQGDASFPQAIPAPRAVLDQFFGPGNNGVTPTTWLVNVNTLQSWPLAQGFTDMNSLLQRINQALETRG